MSTAASDELIEIYNNSDADVDITGWCIAYGEAVSGIVTSSRDLTCFMPSNDPSDDRVMISPHSTIVLVSKAFADGHPGFVYDSVFSNGLVDSGRWISIRDASGMIIDLVEWSGNGIVSLYAEGGKTAVSPTTSQLIQRKQISPGTLKDTDNNFNDFERASARATYSAGSIYELTDTCRNIVGFQAGPPDGYSVTADEECIPLPVDLCANIDGLQEFIPIGYGSVVVGQCEVDVCSNIDGLQDAIPAGMVADAGECVSYDACTNFSGIQPDAPPGFVSDLGRRCLLVATTIVINELLPNAIGDDDGAEYVELYNPTDTGVQLDIYRLVVGAKSYVFPAGLSVGAYTYVYLTNDDIGFTLTNTGVSVAIVTEDGQTVFGPIEYMGADEGLAWAKIDDTWTYTNQPTPGALNKPSIVDDTEEVVTGLKPCPVGQLRNPETNRCRLIVTAGSSLTPCRDGQYRSEETNRCRSIAGDSSLTSCGPGQQRNPATNRCRSTDTNELVPCADNQVRNPDTNRCRNVLGASIPSAGFAAVPVADTAQASLWWWALGGLGLIALAYAGWEWRVEIAGLLRRMGISVSSRFR